MVRFFCVVVFVSLGCGQQTNPGRSSSAHPDINATRQMTGSWELRSHYGGNRAGSNGDESAPGNGNVYTFTGNHFEHYEDHKLLDSGKYTIAKSRGPENGDSLDAFAFNGIDTVLFILSGDTLTLNPRAPMYDGVARKYVRVFVR